MSALLKQCTFKVWEGVEVKARGVEVETLVLESQQQVVLTTCQNSALPFLDVTRNLY